MEGADNAPNSFENTIYSEMERLWHDETFDNIFGVDLCSDMLKENIVLPFRFPHLYTKPERAFMLYGAPGSGKTHLLSAAANASGAKLFVFNVWNLQSRIFRNTDEVLKAIFKIAREHTPSILCFEDIEVLSGDDMNGAKMSFLSEMHNFLHKDLWHLVVVIGLSQAPWKIDSSVRTIFTWSPGSHVSLPNAEARFKVLETHCEKIPHNLGQEHFTTLACRTSGFTGADLVLLITSASMRLIGKLSKASYFKKILVKSGSENKTKTAKKNVQDKLSKSISKQSMENDSNSGLSCTEDKTLYSDGGKSTFKSSTKMADSQRGSGASSFEGGGEVGDLTVEKFVPCSAEDIGAFPASVRDLPADEVQVSEMSMQDVEEELSNMKPTLDNEWLEKISGFGSEISAF